MFKRIFIVLFLFFGLFLVFSTAFAAWELEVDWPPTPLGTDLATSSDLTVLVQYFYEWGIALGGLAAFIALLIAGFLYLTSVGDPNKMTDARGRIVSALAGLVLLLAAWIVLNTINPDLTTLSFGCDCASAAVSCTDCPSGYVCIGDPNPGDGKKQGACMSASTFFFCDDKCAQYKNKPNCVAVADCGWDPFGKYCYNKKCAIHGDKITCGADVDCAWDSGNTYCYHKDACTKGFACVGDSKPGDGKKEGVCMSKVSAIPGETEKQDCSYAQVWEGKDFTPSPPIMANFDAKVAIPNDGKGSIASFFDDTNYDSGDNIKCSGATIAACAAFSPNLDGSPACDWNNNKCYKNCGADACGCVLELYDGTDCSDEISPLIQAYSSHLKIYTEDTDFFSLGNGRVDCVILKEPL